MTKEESEKEIQRLIAFANNRIDTSTPDEIKHDMKILVLSLIEFVASAKPELLHKETPDEDKLKLFFKMIANAAMEAVTASVMPGGLKKLEKKYDNLMRIYPLLQKYSNVE